MKVIPFILKTTKSQGTMPTFEVEKDIAAVEPRKKLAPDSLAQILSPLLYLLMKYHTVVICEISLFCMIHSVF